MDKKKIGRSLNLKKNQAAKNFSKKIPTKMLNPKKMTFFKKILICGFSREQLRRVLTSPDSFSFALDKPRQVWTSSGKSGQVPASLDKSRLIFFCFDL